MEHMELELKSKILHDVAEIDQDPSDGDRAKRNINIAYGETQPEITEEQVRAAGYLKKPDSMKPAPSLTTQQLRGELKNVAVAIPKDYLMGNMHGENNVCVYDANGHNLLGDNNLALLMDAICSLAGPNSEITNMLHGAMMPALGMDVSARTNVGDNSGAMVKVKVGAGVEAGAEGENTLACYDGNKCIQRIMSMPLAKQYGVTPTDIVVHKENQGEIAKFLKGNDTTIVKPFSIPGGIIGCNEDCLVAIDNPNIHGQPGLLLAIFREGYFDRAPATSYNPHTYDVVLPEKEHPTIMPALDMFVM